MFARVEPAVATAHAAIFRAGAARLSAVTGPVAARQIAEAEVARSRSAWHRVEVGTDAIDRRACSNRTRLAVLEVIAAAGRVAADPIDAKNRAIDVGQAGGAVGLSGEKDGVEVDGATTTGSGRHGRSGDQGVAVEVDLKAKVVPDIGVAGQQGEVEVPGATAVPIQIDSASIFRCFVVCGSADHDDVVLYLHDAELLPRCGSGRQERAALLPVGAVVAEHDDGVFVVRRRDDVAVQIYVRGKPALVRTLTRHQGRRESESASGRAVVDVQG